MYSAEARVCCDLYVDFSARILHLQRATVNKACCPSKVFGNLSLLQHELFFPAGKRPTLSHYSVLPRRFLLRPLLSLSSRLLSDSTVVRVCAKGVSKFATFLAVSTAKILGLCSDRSPSPSTKLGWWRVSNWCQECCTSQGSSAERRSDTWPFEPSPSPVTFLLQPSTSSLEPVSILTLLTGPYRF